MSTTGAILRAYLRLFLFTGILFSIVLGLIFIIYLILTTGSIHGSTLAGIIAGSVIAGFFFGAIMALVTGTLHILAIRSRHYPLTDETLSVDHVREIALDVPYDEAFDRSVSSLKAVEGSRIESEDREKGWIEAKTPLNWKSWGEKISFEVRKQADDRSLVRVSSRPTIWTTVVDYGKNLVNVEKIAGRIKGQAI